MTLDRAFCDPGVRDHGDLTGKADDDHPQYSLVDGTRDYTGALTISIDDAVANAVTQALRLTHTTTGTPANGIGVGLEFEAETAAGNNEIGAVIEAVATDVSSTNEDFDLAFKTMLSGDAATEVMRINSAGNVIIGSAVDLGSRLQIVNSVGVGLEWRGVDTDAAVKVFQVGATHFTNAEQPMAVMLTIAFSGDNQLYIGGGSGAMNAMMRTGFYAAADNTTITGTEMMRLTSTGLRLQSGISAAPLGLFQVIGTVGGLTFKEDTGFFGVGTDTPDVPFDVETADAVSDAVSRSFRIVHTTSGTPVAGIGIGVSFGVETSAGGNAEIGAAIDTVATDVTPSAENFDLVFSTMIDGAGVTEKVRITSEGNFHLPKTAGTGIKVDIAVPTFGFADLLGDQFTKNVGATKPTLATYNGAISSFQFGDGDEAMMTFHIPHDYVPGTDIYLHVHWSHTSATSTGGTLDFKYFAIYAKAHNQTSGSTFTATPITATFATIDINDGGGGLNQYQQHLTEVIISAATATAALFDRDDFEPDGVIELTLEMDANNMTDSVAVLDPFIHFVDIHYQTTGLIGTKDKAPDFYT